MSGITCALLVGVGVGLAPGLGVGSGFVALGIGAADAVAECPPHPESAAQAARVKTTRLGRSSFFSSFIWGTLSEWQN